LQSKINSYIGFAQKSASVIYGIDSLSRHKGKIYLIIFSRSLSENSLKNARSLIKKCSSPAVIADENALENALNKENCKFIAIKDKNLSEAIIKVASENNGEFKMYSEEEN